MTMLTRQVTLGTAQTLLCNPATSPQRVIIHNDASSQEIFVGPDGVTSATGLHVDGKEEREFLLYPGESLYGVSVGPSAVSVMIQKQT